MGLLDGILGASFDDPKTAATLQLAQGLLSAPRAMQGLAGGLSGYQQAMAQAKQAKMMEEMRSMQMAQQRMQMEAAQREQAKAQGIEGAYRKAYRDPTEMALAQNGGPTPQAAAALPTSRPGYDQNVLATELAKVDPLTAYQLLQPKAPDFKVVGNSLVQIGPDGVKEAYRPPEKPETTSDLKEYMYSRDNEGFRGTFREWQLENNRSKATNVSVPINTGQRGLDNTLKLRGDFRSEPVYKAHQEMQSAYGQIKQSLSAASPAGDLAGATKLMKLLDPGSVVRESELGMAMAATGALDRLTNYATMIVKGTKLTPDQRKDFQSLADRLYSESVNQYNAKRSEYQGIAERNGLSVPDVLGSASEGPKRTPVRNGVHNGRKVVQYADGTVEYAD